MSSVANKGNVDDAEKTKNCRVAPDRVRISTGDDRSRSSMEAHVEKFDRMEINSIKKGGNIKGESRSTSNVAIFNDPL